MTREARAAAFVIPATVALVALLLVLFVFFHYATVEGDSMKPALQPRDVVLLTRGYPVAKRGDIVVFSTDESGRDVEVVKRVVGVPGDEVTVRGDAAFVNGKPAENDGVLLGSDSQRVVGPIRVPDGSLFVLGDNRPVSFDSRFIGLVPIRTVVGRAVAVFAPPTRAHLLDSAGAAR